MRVGWFLDADQEIDGVIGQAAAASAAGLDSVWSSQIFSYDALTLLAVIGREVPGITLGTSVVPTYPRHPVMLATQALTVQAATNARLVLGIGLSHQVVIENVFGQSFDRPIRHMRDYLSVLLPLLRGEQVTFAGETVRASTFAPLDVKAEAPPVLLAALGPAMLSLAGTLADGTVTWMVGPATLEAHVVPTILRAAAGTGRPAPRVVVALPVCVTDDVDAGRQGADAAFGFYGGLPSYRAMLDREGVAGPKDVAVVGSAREVAAQLRHLGDVGATDVVGATFGTAEDRARTLEVLAEVAKG